MYELKRTYMNVNGKEGNLFFKQYNKTIERLELSDEPEAYLMYLRFMEEFISFHKDVDKTNKTTYEVKIIYAKTNH